MECAERGLNPFETNLVVADESRGSGTICLAISPAMKALGVKNRCRLYEIPKDIKYITAMPSMKKYIQYNGDIYDIYLDYMSPQDIVKVSGNARIVKVSGNARIKREFLHYYLEFAWRHANRQIRNSRLIQSYRPTVFFLSLKIDRKSLIFKGFFAFTVHFGIYGAYILCLGSHKMQKSTTPCQGVVLSYR